MKIKIVLVIIVIGLILIFGALGYFGYKRYYNKKAVNKRSAIFMTNGQVYFGYLKDVNDKSVNLEDVYYLKTGDLQSSTDKKIMLVKMGNELHNPSGSMYINREQILFWQTLRDDSKINDAIIKFTSNTQ